MADISKIKLPGGSSYDLKDNNARAAGVYYGRCQTAATTAAKTMSIDGVTSYYAGLHIRVRFDNAQEATGTVTLNVNNLGALELRTYNSSSATASVGEWRGGAVLDIEYQDFSTPYWIIVDGIHASGSIYGRTILSSSTSSTDTDKAATPSAVKAAYDLANGKYTKPSGGIPASDLASGVIPTVPTAYTSNPAMNGTASPGNSGNWSRGNHVHPVDTSRLPVMGRGINLLHNWYFAGGGTGPGVFPVNQRQVFAVTSNSMYFIDRWRAGFIDGYSCSLNSTGIVTTNSSSTAVVIYQTIDNYGKQLLGKQVTCSIQTTAGTYIASGTVPSTFDNSGLVISVRDANSNIIGGLNVSSSDIQFRLRTPENLNVTFVAAKLELGNLSTLVINNVLTEIPDYDEELLKCQTAITTVTDIYANKIVSVNTPNPNLLDNWYFVGGGSASQNEGAFPINQIGATTYTSGYTIDRWKFTADSQMVLTLDSGKIRLTKSTNSANPKWVQIINDDTLVGKTATFSILYRASYSASNQLQISIGRSVSKTVPVSTSDYNICSVTGVIAKDTWGSVTDSIYVGVSLFSSFVANTDYIDILAAKLELGTQQTLAYLAGSSWVLADFPNYETEFIKCLTSSADPYDYLSNKAIAVDNSNENLLSNWYFKKSQTRGGQLPINTRNLTTINTGKTYLIDNWAIFDGSGTASLSTNGITLVGSGNFLRFGTQIPFWKIEGREITLSIMIKSITGGTLTVFLGESSSDIINNYSPSGMGSITTTTAGNFWVYGTPTRNSSGNANDLCNILIRVPDGCTAVIEAIKLEYGTIQTLFKQEGGTAVLRDIPDYSLEYQKCITNSVQAKDLYANQRAGIIEIKCSSVSSTSLTYYHPLIRSTDTVLTYMLSQPNAQRAAITVTTYDGRLTFSNAFVSNTTTDITLVLGSSLPTLTATTS